MSPSRILPAWLACCCAAAGCDAGTPGAGPPPRQLVVGLSNMSRQVTELAPQLGVGWVRQTIGWDDVDGLFVDAGPLTLEQAFSDEALFAYTAGHDFAAADRMVGRFTDQGILVVAGVGSGWVQAVPRLRDGRPAAPDSLGRETYLAWQVLVTRALVERYDGDGLLDAPGGVHVVAWQVENELNEAAFTAFGSQRYPFGLDALTSAWTDEAYLDQIFDQLCRAVRAADPRAIVLTNLHVSVHPELDRALDVPTWDQWLVRWRDRLDWVGIDVYPNFLTPMPIGIAEVEDRLARAIELAGDRPVYVIETGYPSGPEVLGYTEAQQADYMRATLEAVRESGAAGIFWYGTRTIETTKVRIDARDLETMDRLRAAYAEGDMRTIVQIMSEDVAYFQEHMALVMNAQQGYWGLVREDGSKKPAWDVLVEETSR
jgi:hypothetical protein